MRSTFCKSLVNHASDPNFAFLTGDLGYMALEPLQQAMGRRFINAGVAEQNMVSVAAGLAKSGMRPFVYSIAPFIYARPFEQLRNDVCLHKLPVVAVGNGGGYGYGVMGASHHALEDYGCLSTLPDMRIFTPAFNDDLVVMVEKLFESKTPAYLRLGRDEKPDGFALPTYAPFRKILEGDAGVAVFCGPLVGEYLKLALTLSPAQRPQIWLLSEFTGENFVLPQIFLKACSANDVIVCEEHVAQGGIGTRVAYELLRNDVRTASFSHHFAKGYKTEKYGSQQYHRLHSGIDANTIHAVVCKQLGSKKAVNA